MRSMTGFGRGTAERGDRRAVVEIRSVNHRFLDIKVRSAASTLPGSGPGKTTGKPQSSAIDPALEERVATRIRAVCERGAIIASVRLDARGALAALRVDVEAARRIHGELSRLAAALGEEPVIGLDLLCAQPGVLVPADDDADSESASDCVAEAVDQALVRLVAMRETEGESLARDLSGRMAHLDELVAATARHADALPDEIRQRLCERIARLLDRSTSSGPRVDIDQGRLAQEVAFLAERADVTEELVRLRSHLEQFGELVHQPAGPVGRRLEFLVQEIVREVNTVGSKSQSTAIARITVEAKSELEKIREQIQNVE